MHKKILIFCFLFLLIGCKKIEETSNYIDLVNNCLKEKTITNSVSLGYKYYIPKGVKKLKNYNNNQVFLVDNNYMYLYVDLISYYHKKPMIMNQNNSLYSKKIKNKQKEGYIEVIKKNDNKYFVSILYNYSKIEVYTTKKQINKIIALSTIILNSIDYNDKMIEQIINGNLGEFSEFSYEVEKPEGANSNFSQYLEEYVQKEEEKEQLPDE